MEDRYELRHRAARLVLAVAIVAVAAPVNACTCAMDERPALQALADNSAVFLGTVLSVSLQEGAKFGGSVPEEYFPQDQELQVRFRVWKSWKGIAVSSVIVTTQWFGSACGYHFDVGHSYLVWAMDRGRGTLATGICSRTQDSVAAAHQMRQLGKPAKVFE
jgi:hypothetical protein